MVKHELRVGATIQIGEAVIRLDHKSGQRVCLVIDAPSDVPIIRQDKKGDTDQNQAKSNLTLA